MTCSCHITGESAKAIAGFGNSHPYDPSDLLRCINYWGEGRTAELQRRMAGKSIYWDRLLPHWDELVALLREEMEAPDGRAPRTYFEMKRVLDDGIACTTCDATGVQYACLKCKGTGRRSGGRCRPCYGSGTSEYCTDCRGRGYTTTHLAVNA